MGRRLLRVLAFFAAFVATLAALDAFLQLAEIQCPLEDKLDRRIGLLYAPDFKLSRFSEGFFLGRTNDYGCLGRGAPRERDGKSIRIILMGDSFTLGHTVFERDHFARWIERIVSQGTGQRVEVLNFGRADFALTNLYQHYRDFASQWKPDLALFLFNETDLDPYRQAAPSLYPTAFVQADTLCYEYSFADSRKSRMFEKYGTILNHVVLPRLVFDVLKQVDRKEVPHLLLDKLAAGVPLQIVPRKSRGRPSTRSPCRSCRAWSCSISRGIPRRSRY